MYHPGHNRYYFRILLEKLVQKISCCPFVVVSLYWLPCKFHKFYVSLWFGKRKLRLCVAMLWIIFALCPDCLVSPSLGVHLLLVLWFWMNSCVFKLLRSVRTSFHRSIGQSISTAHEVYYEILIFWMDSFVSVCLILLKGEQEMVGLGRFF